MTSTVFVWMRRCAVALTGFASIHAVPAAGPAVAQADMVFAAARVNAREACAVHAQASTMTPAEREHFLRLCPKSTAPLADLERNARLAAARVSEMRQRDDASNTPDQVRSKNHNHCQSQNQSGMLVFDCACVVREADRQMSVATLSRKTIAHGEFDWSPCIDRERSADRIVGANFDPGSVRMYTNAGIDVEALKTCQHRAVAQDMPRESLLDAGTLRAELKRRCVRPPGR